MFRSNETNGSIPTEMISDKNNEIRNQRKKNQIKSKREELKNNRKTKDEVMENINVNSPPTNKELLIWCNLCKNIIKIKDITNIDKIYKPNPFEKIDLTESLSDQKQAIDNLLKKVESWRKNPITRKQLEETILLNRGSKQWGRAIVKNQEKTKVIKVKKTRRCKYIALINRVPINYRVFYEEMENKGLIKGNKNIISELRTMKTRNIKKRGINSFKEEIHNEFNSNGKNIKN